MRVTFTELEVGGPRDAGLVNTMFADLLTASTNVEADNIREEGLDHRALADNAGTDLIGTAQEQSAQTHSNTAFGRLTINGTPIAVTGFTLNHPALVIGTFQLVTDSTIPQPGVDADLYVEARIAFDNGGVVNRAVRRRGNDDRYHDGAIVLSTVLDPGTYSYVEIETRISAAGNYRPGYAMLHVMEYRRSM